MKNTMDKIASPVEVEQFTDRFATAVSAVTNPLFVAIPTLGLLLFILRQMLSRD